MGQPAYGPDLEHNGSVSTYLENKPCGKEIWLKKCLLYKKKCCINCVSLKYNTIEQKTMIKIIIFICTLKKLNLVTLKFILTNVSMELLKRRSSRKLKKEKSNMGLKLHVFSYFLTVIYTFKTINILKPGKT